MRLYPLRFVTFLQSSGPSWNTSVAKIELGPGRSTEYGTSSGSPTGSRRVQSLNTYGLMSTARKGRDSTELDEVSQRAAKQPRAGSRVHTRFGYAAPDDLATRVGLPSHVAEFSSHESSVNEKRDSGLDAEPPSSDWPDFYDDPLAGTKYRTLGDLSEGGLGRVLEAEGPDGSVVAVKFPRVDPTSTLADPDRFRLEADSLRSFSHPNLIRVLDVGFTEDGRPFLVLERLYGRTLDDELQERGALPPAEAIFICNQILAGLGEAHVRGIIHRDIKLGNVWLCDPEGESRRVVLFDFGLAKVMEGSEHISIEPLRVPTSAGMVLGTPRYASPEQAASEALDPRSDVYSVGLVLRTMLTGREPFDAIHSGSQLLTAQLMRDLEPLSPTLVGSKVLQTILDRALAKEPTQRYADTAEFRDALHRAWPLVTSGPRRAPHRITDLVQTEAARSIEPAAAPPVKPKAKEEAMAENKQHRTAKTNAFPVRAAVRRLSPAVSWLQLGVIALAFAAGTCLLLWGFAR